MTTEYPFIKHIPIAIVMSISHISGCATICGKRKQRDYTYFDYLVFGFPFSGKERSTVSYKYRAAPDTALTSNRANDTPVQSQVERDKTVATNEGSR